MKKELRKAISLFSPWKKMQLYWAILLLKLKIPLSSFHKKLLQECSFFSELIEKGVHIENADKTCFSVNVKINNKHIKLFLRKKGSDLKVFDSVILNREYAHAIKHSEKSEIDTIIDAGGNIGLVSIFFHCYFPKAKIYIIEPDEKNFIMLQKNIAANEIRNALLFKNALWVNNDNLNIRNDFRDGEDWSLTVENADSKTSSSNTNLLKGITLQSLCAQQKISSIDFFKIDIEGAERFLFQDNEFLNHVESKVNNMIIEIHDEFNIRESIYTKMKMQGFKIFEEESVTYFERPFKNQ
ncbi:MAG: FkbM family methyltransferase [Bacteroidota bacterium]